LPPDPTKVPPAEAARAGACADYLDASTLVKDDRAALAWTKDWQARRANVPEGQVLFELNCARCHTEGWSVFDPTAPPTSTTAFGANILGLAGGGGGQGGGIGFNLRGGDVARRFGSDAEGGFDQQLQFITDGSEANKPYGRGGIGSG